MLPILDRMTGPFIDGYVVASLWVGLAAAALAIAHSVDQRRLITRLAIQGLPFLLVSSLVVPLAYSPFDAWIAWFDASTLLAVPAESSFLLTGLRLVLVLYAIGVAAGLAWLAIGGLAGGLIVRRSERPSPATIELFAVIAPVGGRRRRLPRLRVSHLVRQPILLGWFRPTILIPADWEATESRDRLHLALLHELAHAEHGDPAFNLWAGLAKITAFGVPALGWIIRRNRLDQEILADRVAAIRFGGPTAYASILVGAAATPALTGLLQRSAVASGVWTPLRERLTVLLDSARSPASTASGWSNLPVITSAVLTFGLLVPIETRLPQIQPTAVPIPQARLETLRLARIEVPARGAGRPPFELPLQLNDRFEVDLELWANHESLASTRLSGILLAVPSSVGPIPAWHRITLRSHAHGRSVSINGQYVAASDTPRRSSCFTIEPARGTIGRFRNIVIRH